MSFTPPSIRRRRTRGVRSWRSLGVLSALGLLVAGLAVVSTAQPASAAARHTAWAPASSASITPGVQAYTAGGQCTTNFVFTDAAGGVYIGYAAHCAGLGEATDTNGCENDSQPLGTRVTFNKGGSLLSNGALIGSGELVYSSWRTMRDLGVTDANTCAFNDFALVKVRAADVAKVNPSVPFWGGPTGIDTDGVAAGERVWSYGNSSLRAGISLLSPKVGLSLGTSGGGWSHSLYTLTPGIPGDSGSAFLSAGGKAVGTLSTLGLTPLPLSNNIGDLSRELAFAQQHSGIDGLELALGTVAFTGIG
ncbi:hypothetical protein [Nocardioides sp. R-C-SC26]|uniref:hypothetical protein n=1 Tax=Nocardioides sp. R-C-SC26 TaxID=2870414 RepID=UPI001E5951D9|nr:hypothetical protein [Nocardioides sp. R-C-SC26]